MPNFKSKLTFMDYRNELLQLFDHDPGVQKKISEWCSENNCPVIDVAFDTPLYEYFYKCTNKYKIFYKDIALGGDANSKTYYEVMLKNLIAFYSALNGNGIKYEFNTFWELKKAMYNLFINLGSLLTLTHKLAENIYNHQLKDKYFTMTNEHNGTKEECFLVAESLSDYSHELIYTSGYYHDKPNAYAWLDYEFKVFDRVKEKLVGTLRISYDFVSPLEDIISSLMRSAKDFQNTVKVTGDIVFNAADSSWDCVLRNFGPITVSEVNLQKDLNRLILK
jgi:hypothetical protein